MRLELTEKEIVNAVRAGRREGQTEMVCHYAERVFAMIVRQVPDVMDAQELTQDTFLRAFSHITATMPIKHRSPLGFAASATV